MLWTVAVWVTTLCSLARRRPLAQDPTVDGRIILKCPEEAKVCRDQWRSSPTWAKLYEGITLGGRGTGMKPWGGRGAEFQEQEAQGARP